MFSHKKVKPSLHAVKPLIVSVAILPLLSILMAGTVVRATTTTNSGESGKCSQFSLGGATDYRQLPGSEGDNGQGLRGDNRQNLLKGSEGENGSLGGRNQGPLKGEEGERDSSSLGGNNQGRPALKGESGLSGSNRDKPALKGESGERTQDSRLGGTTQGLPDLSGERSCPFSGTPAQCPLSCSQVELTQLDCHQIEVKLESLPTISARDGCENLPYIRMIVIPAMAPDSLPDVASCKETCLKKVIEYCKVQPSPDGKCQCQPFQRDTCKFEVVTCPVQHLYEDHPCIILSKTCPVAASQSAGEGQGRVHLCISLAEKSPQQSAESLARIKAFRCAELSEATGKSDDRFVIHWLIPHELADKKRLWIMWIPVLPLSPASPQPSAS
ncbi:hypothetical protein [Streptococcus ruminantium]|uniref:hypothetical protein n=1 Tax=Streptococcus ruminantium TaxID=1917441 RepID=UPI0012DDFD99|nr:hypothetical protein [Streptococcus ruminantium]